MGKKIKVFAVIALFLLISGVAAYFYKDTYYESKAVEKSDYILCAKIGSDLKITQCIAEIALKNDDASICTKSQKAYLSDCFKIFAERNRDITACQKVDSKEEKYNCYFAFVDILRDVSICGSLEEGEDENYCLRSVAVVNGDASICSTIPAYSMYKRTCEMDVEYHNY